MYVCMYVQYVYYVLKVLCVSVCMYVCLYVVRMNNFFMLHQHYLLYYTIIHNYTLHIPDLYLQSVPVY
jgi:hypothetical protein